MTALLPSDPGHSNHLISTGGLRARRVERQTGKLRLNTKEKLVKLCQNNRNEVCGFIDQREHIHLVKNVHESPRYNFYMDKESFASVVQQVYEVDKSKIIGIFHTHPNNQSWPSPRDIAGWPNRDLNWRYFIATNDELVEWETYLP